ncbi:MAG: type VI secretion system tip protein VgrG [Gammaproteobacteria bacterium]|nr:type VI secretion system tip protein VgrG [Gammaproteobacteria bacterium]MDH5802371.1 type VI secretion system tip protein VgrG [Gammaproteobacteria bacterium]
MILLQEAREVELSTTLGENILLFHSMNAREQMGRCFEFELEVASTDPNIKLTDALGQTMTVRLSRPDGTKRFFHGYATRFSYAGIQESHHLYQVTLRPWLWFLTRTSNCRIFQQKTAPEIIKQVFRDHGFSDFEEKLSDSYRTWEYCVQYRETDFNFVSRLMEQEGIYYYFKHDKDKHTLVLSDSIEAHSTQSGYEQIPYYPESVRQRERDHISDWFVTREVQPGSYALNDFNFKTPSTDLKVKRDMPGQHAMDDFEIFDYPGEYPERGDGEEYVRKRIEELKAQHEILNGEGNARGLMVGALFELAQHPRMDQNREYLITSAEHIIKAGVYSSGAIGGSRSGQEETYTCSFSCMNSSVTFRSPRLTPKPSVQGPQTAIVVGPSGQEIHTDEHGRVKVQFHWDRAGQADENSSCWIRVSHPTAGKNWGGVQIPRIGQEVIVDFLEGDPDQPIITGRLYNGEAKPPYELPAKGMVAGMKTNSTPGGGGYNEMSMNDTKGEEMITIHAQFNMDTTVQNDQTDTINNNRTTTVAVDDTETVGNNQTVSVGVNQSTSVGSNQSINVGAAKTENVAAAKATSIGGAYQISVGAAMNETIGAAKAEEIGAAKSVNVGANSSENIGNNKSVNAGKDISVSSGKKMSFSAGDDFSINGAKNGVIEIKDKLTIKVGKATLTLEKNGDVSLNGKKIQIKGSGDVIIKGKKILQN